MKNCLSMTGKLLIIILFLNISLSKLVYVATQFRHGARYPQSKDYDIYDSNETRQFSSQLTTVGMRQTYLLGTYMKSDYIDKYKIINSTLFTKQVQMFTSTSQRCMQSAICFALGLFPFGTGATLPNNISQEYLKPPFQSFLINNLRSNNGGDNSEFGLKLGFQPTPSTTNNHFFRCSREGQLIDSRVQAVKVKIAQLQNEQKAFIQRLKLIFNLKQQYTSLIGLTQVFDLVICDTYLGRKLPTQFTPQDFKQLNYINAYLFTLVYSDYVARVFSTPILSFILNNMDNIIKKGKEQVKRFSIFGGHDSNIVPLLTFLNLTSAQCIANQFKNKTVNQNCAQVVPFASNIIFQLHDSDTSPGKYYVKVRYNGNYFNLCEKNIPQCDYEDFSARARRGFVDFNKQCPSTNQDLPQNQRFSQLFDMLYQQRNSQAEIRQFSDIAKSKMIVEE